MRLPRCTRNNTKGMRLPRSARNDAKRMRLPRCTRNDKEDKTAMLLALTMRIRPLHFVHNDTVGSSLSLFQSLGENKFKK